MTLNDCGLICLGGSENRTCECAGPSECTKRNHPDFDKQRVKAVERFQRTIFRALDLNSKYGHVDKNVFSDLVRLSADKFESPTTQELVALRKAMPK